jgi:3-oxoacyl-[acyl-carrier protein] reductase
VLGLTRAAAAEFAKDGITVNAICPGSVATDRAISSSLREHGSVEVGLAKRAATIPVGRNGTPDDLAAAIAFLASPAASYITGVTLSVDGGSSG